MRWTHSFLCERFAADERAGPESRGFHRCWLGGRGRSLRTVTVVLKVGILPVLRGGSALVFGRRASAH